MTADNPHRSDPPAPALTWHRVTIRGGPNAQTCRITLDGQTVQPSRIKVEGDAGGALYVTLTFPAIVDIEIDAEVLDDQAGVVRGGQCRSSTSIDGDPRRCHLERGHIGPHQTHRDGGAPYQWLELTGPERPE